MDRFLNAIKSQAGQLDAMRGEPRFAVVTSVDTTTAAARVLLQPDGGLTGWLPVLSPWTGAGWGMICLPAPGDQVFVIPQEGNAEHGVVVGRSYSTTQRPPNVPIGEFWLVHKSGTSIKLTNNGEVTIVGTVRVAGDVYDNVGSMAHLRNSFNQHIHLDSRHGATSPPTIPD